MKLLKKNLLFLFILLGCAFCFLLKDQQLTETIAIHPDSEVLFASGSQLSQTWSPHTRKITQISLPYTANADFTSGFTLSVIPSYPGADENAVVSASIQPRSFQSGESGTLTFAFDTASLQLGRQYQFLFTYTETEAGGSLSIPSSSEYGGCSVDGVSAASGLMMDITFVKNSRIFLLFGIFAPLLAFSLFFMLLFHKKFEETAALSAVVLVFILYIAGLTEHLELGMYAVFLLAFCAFLCSIFLFQKKDRTWKDLLSPGLFVFVVFSLIILVYNANMQRSIWDEFSHWGLAAKDMFYFGSFGKHADSTVFLPWYPPFITLFQYYVQFQNGLFSESLLYVAFQIMICCFLIAGLKDLSFKTLRLLPAGLLILLCIPIIFFPEVFNSIMVDPLLAIFLAYTVLCYFTAPLSIFNFLRIAGGLFALTLTKEMGAPIAGLATILFILDFLYKQRKLFTKSLLPLCSLTLLVVLFFCSWRIYLAIPAPQSASAAAESLAAAESSAETAVGTDTASSESSPAGSAEEAAKASAASQDTQPVTAIPTSTAGFTLQNFTEFLSGNAPDWRYETAKNYVKFLFSSPSYTLGPISLSTLDLCFLLLIAAFLLSRTARWGKDKGIFSMGIFGVLCLLPYLSFLLVCYLFAFSATEAKMLHSSSRYVASYLAGILLAFVLYLFMNLCRQAENESAASENKRLSSPGSICVVLSLVLLIVTPLENLTNKYLGTVNSYDYFYGTEDCARALRSFADQTDKVYLVCNNSGGFSYWVFRNAISPLSTQDGGWNLFSSREDYLAYEAEYLEEPDANRTILSASDWAAQLYSGYDYVFLLHANEAFASMYGDLFEDPASICDGTFYQVNRLEDGGVSLSYIGRVGIKWYK